MKGLALFLSLFILTGCSKTDDVTIRRTEGHRLEENNAFFTGAYVQFDESIPDIAAFEEKCGEHSIYATEVFIDEAEQAADFILMCLANGKLPYIIIKGREDIGEKSGIEYADLMAEAIGRYQTEVMIEICGDSYYYDGGKYFAEAVSEKNSSALIVWSLKYEDIVIAEGNIPEYADMICVNGYIRSENTINSFFDLRETADRAVIIRFGAAVYSDCTYSTEEAYKAIACAYEKISKDSTCIGVIYMNKGERLSRKVNYTDYRVTSDRELSEKYKALIEEMNKEGYGFDKRRYS